MEAQYANRPDTQPVCIGNLDVQRLIKPSQGQKAELYMCVAVMA
jgi:hypothetical protein